MLGALLCFTLLCSVFHPVVLCCAVPLSEHGVPGEAIAEAYDAFEKGTVVSPLAAAAVSNQTIQESMKLVLLVRSYQVGTGLVSLMGKGFQKLVFGEGSGSSCDLDCKGSCGCWCNHARW